MSLYTRMGAAAATGVPSGAAVDVAKATDSDAQAGQAGRMLAPRNPFAASVATAPISASPVSDSGAPLTGWNAGLVRALDNVGKGLATGLTWSGYGVRAVKDYYTAAVRAPQVTAAAARQRGGVQSGLGGMGAGIEALLGLVPGAGFVFPEFRRQWGTITTPDPNLPQAGGVANHGSLGQTFLAPFHDPDPNNANPYDFLDDPKFAAPGPPDPATGKPTPSERDLYYSTGLVKWTSGVIDATADLTLDPLIFGGKALGVARAAHNAVTVADVARAAEAATAGAQATGKASRLQTVVTRLIDASERVRTQQAKGVTGGHAALTSTRTVSALSDPGAVTSWLRAADDIVDETARVRVKALGIYAGLGDHASLAALRTENEVKALQLKALAGPDRASEIEALMSRGDRSFAQRLAAVDADPDMERVVAAYEAQINAERDAAERLIRLGSGDGTTAGKASLTGFRLTERNGRDLTQVARRIPTADGLPSIHYVGRATSMHAPRIVQYDSPNFLAQLTAHIGASRAFLGASEATDQAFGRLLDRAAVAHGAIDAQAAAPELRKIVDEYKALMIDHTARRLAAKGGKIDGRAYQQAKDAVTQVINARDDSMLYLGDQAYRAAKTVATQDHGAIAVVDRDVLTPFSPTQWDKSAVLTDFQHVYNTMAGAFKGNFDGWVRQGMAGTKKGVWTLTQSGLDVVNDLWKFGTLFRLGYLARAQADTQMRNLFTLGPLVYGTHLASGGWDFIQNGRKVTEAQAAWAGDVFGARLRQTMITLEYPDEYLTRTLPKAVQAEWDALEAVAATKMPATVGARTVKVQDSALARYIGKPTLTRSGEVKGDMATAAYQSLADFQRSMPTISSEASVLNLMTSGYQEGLAKVRTGHFQPIPGSNSNWPAAYAAFVNKHVRSDPMARQLLARWDDPAVDGELAAWLRGAEGTSEPDVGRAIWAEISGKYPGSYADPEDLVAAVREQVGLLLPDARARELALSRDLTDVDSTTLWETAIERPAVPHERMQTPNVQTRQFTAAYKAMTTWYFDKFGSMPETMWGRHPFYAERKAGYMQAALGEARAAGESITVSEYNALAKRASLLAKKDVSRYMFDTSQRSNLNYSMRFLSPFYGAWSDTMRKWALIVGEHPEAIGIGSAIFSAPRRIFVVQDDNGNVIRPDGTKVDPSGNIVGHSVNPFDGNLLLPIPSWLPDPGTGGHVKVALSSLNVIFQGDPFWLPGPGPLATIPVNTLAMKSFPEMWDDQSAAGVALRYMLPYGLDESNADQATPGWLRNLGSALGGQGGLLGVGGGNSYAQTFASLMAEEVNAEEQGQRPRLSEGELYDTIANRTRNWFLLRLAGSESGWNVQPTTRMDYWRDEYQRYKRTYPNANRLAEDGTQMSAEEAFYADHPDYFEATISLSVNETGIAATDESWAPTTKYLSDIRTNPQYGWMYVGAANLAPGFDPGVYTAQKSLGMRSTKDPVQASDDLKVSAGWFQYGKLNGAVQTELLRRSEAGGSASLSAKANADLADVRTRWLAAYKDENPTWAASYESGASGGGADSFLRAAAAAAQAHPELMDRSDFQYLEQYVTLRELIRAELDRRGLAQITSPGAEDLEDVMTRWTAAAVNENLGFQQMVNRGGLDRDVIGRTSTTMGVG